MSKIKCDASAFVRRFAVRWNVARSRSWRRPYSAFSIYTQQSNINRDRTTINGRMCRIFNEWANKQLYTHPCTWFSNRLELPKNSHFNLNAAVHPHVNTAELSALEALKAMVGMIYYSKNACHHFCMPSIQGFYCHFTFNTLEIRGDVGRWRGLWDINNDVPI